MRKTSIIILTYNHLEYTKRCIQSIRKYTKKDTYEIIIVDNYSTDGTRKWLEEQKDIKVIYNLQNEGFPKGCNIGIMKKEKENDVLLLNNDTIVTPSWLENLQTCLYSKKEIGAVGAVCNQTENDQGVSFTYDNFDEMECLAKENNISNKEKWEEKVFLIGFCMLIKKEVIEKIGKLDEAYTPGYVEDNDLSLQILKLGYRLYLCHDAFVHHHLGTSFRSDMTKLYPILEKNRAYFYQKWKFNAFSCDCVKTSSFPLIKDPKRVLELDCGLGCTLLKLKYFYPNIIVEGVEEKKEKREIASLFAPVYSKLREAKKGYYDVILIGDLLEKVENPKQFLKRIKTYLKKDGRLILEVHNMASIENIKFLLWGYCYEIHKDKKNGFLLREVKALLESLSYQDIVVYSWYKKLTEEEEVLFQKLGEKKELIYTSYTVSASARCT